ncbi:ESX secretion-associated protein EspG [Nocardia sp. NEAU-G5]|uniref:ESX secretion-associated protein EspG n=1 Tax=Nocardia albiluteola TaxID=2842303 RepID=A0ABS6BCS1_9NOCA|nr:ESX secretion-associated protein EspG [Nocardia albiluteola]MBU3068090.1 ESX secretion-associated protein EspG [Nocardia albiluteola]
MERTWQLTGLEYLVLRERLLGRPNSWPFRTVTTITSAWDYQFAKARLWGELQARWDAELAEVLKASLDPDLRLIAQVFGTRDNNATRDLLTAKRFGDRAVVIQGFNPTSLYSHDRLEITLCDAAAMSRVLVDRLPPMTPGSQPRVTLLSYDKEESVDHWTRGNSGFYDDGDTVDTQSRHWQAAPKSRVGSIQITQGQSRFGPRGKVTKHIFWEEHHGDGCYVIDLEPPIAAVAAGSEQLRAGIDAQCAELLIVGQDESRQGSARESVYDKW